MKNFFSLKRLASCSLNPTTSFRRVVFRLIAGLVLSLAVIGVAPHLVSEAQRARIPNRVWNVASQPAGDGTMVSIAADSPLGRSQNWQDSEGYHLVIPNTVPADSLKTIRGVKVRRVGTSMEVLFQTRPGSTVNVQAEGNEITLVVDKKLEAQQIDHEARNNTKSAEEQQLFEDQTSARQYNPTMRRPNSHRRLTI